MAAGRPRFGFWPISTVFALLGIFIIFVIVAASMIYKYSVENKMGTCMSICGIFLIEVREPNTGLHVRILVEAFEVTLSHS